MYLGFTFLTFIGNKQTSQTYRKILCEFHYLIIAFKLFPLKSSIFSPSETYVKTYIINIRIFIIIIIIIIIKGQPILQ